MALEYSINIYGARKVRKVTTPLSVPRQSNIHLTKKAGEFQKCNLDVRTHYMRSSSVLNLEKATENGMLTAYGPSCMNRSSVFQQEIQGRQGVLEG